MARVGVAPFGRRKRSIRDRHIELRYVMAPKMVDEINRRKFKPIAQPPHFIFLDYPSTLCLTVPAPLKQNYRLCLLQRSRGAGSDMLMMGEDNDLRRLAELT